MPHKGEQIFVHFPSDDEEEVITISTIRGTSGLMSDTPSMSKPTEKCMETKWGKKMSLKEEQIDFQTPLVQAVFSEDGIELISNDTIEITSETELHIGKSELEAEQGGAEETAEIRIEAEERLSFVVTSTMTGFELEENVDLYDIFQITMEGSKKAAYPTIISEGMNAGEAAKQAAAEKAAAEAAALAAAEQAAAEQAAAEAKKREPLWERIETGVKKAAVGIAIGVCVVVAAPVIAAASTAVAVAGCIIATGSFFVGASLFCEGANDVQLGIQGYSEEEVPSTDGWGALSMTGHRMEIMQGCMSAAMLALTGAELLTAVPGLLSYGTYLLNAQISKLPPIWPSVTDGITGMSGGAATWGKMLDFVNVPSIPAVFAPAVPVFALAADAQAISIVGDGISKMAGSGGEITNEGSGQTSFEPPKVYKNSKGQITNGTHTIDSQGMEKHLDGTPGKSQFLYDVDAEKAVLDASAYADANNLWQPSSGNPADFADKAKVPVINGNVGVTGSGELTNYINIYRTKTGFVHGCPGNPGN